ncbi:hypothetical protein CXB51_031275 [Gossypium anomalum]|uniref:Uncharacterized protein n=1 Tax=Gossypium anomalum TaxID=47600 RepID=A0A8J5Y1W1_9ROSI|nr:hypothetical protein CXB51_031275 [Gossypium anomalum]
MAANSQQFLPVTKPTRRVHGLSSLSLEDKIDKLTNVVQNFLLDKMGPVTPLTRICHRNGVTRSPPNQQLSPPKSSLEAIVERLANSTKKFQQKIDMHLQELDKQVSKLTLMVSYLESQDKKELDIKAPVESAPQKSFVVPPLFLGRLVQCKKEQKEKEMLDTF